MQQVVGPYRLEGELAAGAMGTVYRARRTDGVGDVVALKLMHPALVADASAMDRFRREADLGRRIRHPNVVRTIDAGEGMLGERRAPYLAMELVEGETLREVLRSQGPLAEAVVRRVGHEVACGLAAIHAAGILHRDIKPENILLEADGAVKLMDLGVSRLQEEAIRLSRTGQFLGSMLYAAPEQLGGAQETDASADLFAVGVVLHELLTGRHPFHSDDLRAMVRRQMSEAPEPLEVGSAVSPFLAAVIARLLRKRSDARFPSAAVLARVFDEGEASAWWQEQPREALDDQRMAPGPLRRELPFVGRDDERRALRRWILESRGRGHVVLIEGAAGVGKSRLVEEVLLGLARGGEELTVLAGRYRPGGAATEFDGFAQALRGFLGRFDEEHVRAVLPSLPDLAGAFAALLRAEPTRDGGEALPSDAVHAVFGDALRHIAGRRPAVLWIEDLQHAPAGGRALFAAISFLVRNTDLALIATAEIGSLEPWCSELQRATPLERMRVLPLAVEAVHEGLARFLDSKRLASDLAPLVTTRSGGNPAIVLAILDQLRDDAVLRRAPDGTWTSTRAGHAIRELPVPSSLRDWIAAQVVELSPEDRELLDVACCLGDAFDSELVAAALERRSLDVLRRLGRMVQRRRLIASSGDAFRFSNPQVREHLYGELPPALRKANHLALAQAMQDAATPVHGLAATCEQWIRAGRALDALPHLDAALKQLDRSGQNGRSAALLDDMLRDAALDAAARFRLVMQRVARGTLRAGYLGSEDREDELLDEAARLAAGLDDAARAELERARGRRAEAQGKLSEARSSYQRASALRGEDPEPAERMTLELALARVAREGGLPEEALTRDKLVYDLATEVGDTGRQWASAAGLGHTLRNLGRLSEARAWYARAVDFAEASSIPRRVLSSRVSLAWIEWLLERSAEAGQTILACVREARRIGYRRGEAYYSSRLGDLFTNCGRYVEAEARMTDAVELHADYGNWKGEFYAHVRLARIAIVLGDMEDAGRRLSRAERLSHHDCPVAHRGRFGRLQAELAAQRGDPEGARRRLSDVAQLLRSSAPEELTDILVDRARLALELGETASARRDLTEVAEITRTRTYLESTLRAVCAAAAFSPEHCDVALRDYETLESRVPPHVLLEAELALARATGRAAFLERARATHARMGEALPPARRRICERHYSHLLKGADAGSP